MFMSPSNNYYEKYLKSRRFTRKVQVDNKEKGNIL